jgi:spoIIIJ-associated protein
MPGSEDAVSTLDPEMEDGFEGDDFDGDAVEQAPVVAQSSTPTPLPAPVNPPAPVVAAPVPVAPAPVAPVAEPVAAVAPVAAAAPVERTERVERSERPERGERGDRAPRHSTPAVSAPELQALAIKATQDLMAAMGFDAQVSAKAEGTRVDVTLEVGQDDELLTGYRGETRQALEHLLNRFVNRGEGSRYHLQLEINDFWLRREEELATMAKELAEKAVAENAEVVTDFLNSQERRIVHVTLKEDPRVKTYSLGHDRTKRVSIVPASFPDPTGEEHAG